MAEVHAALAGQEPGETYRSMMLQTCASYRLQLTEPKVRAQADAQCAALEAQPKAVTTDCQPNYQGGVSCTTSAH